MTEVEISPGAKRDLDRLTDFLLASDVGSAAETTDLIISAFSALREHPAIGRSVEHGHKKIKMQWYYQFFIINCEKV